jgi:hypothetical protein
LLVAVPQIEQVQLAGSVLLCAGGKAKLGAKRCVFIVDLIRHRHSGVGDDCLPAYDGYGEEQDRRKNRWSVTPCQFSSPKAASSNNAPTSVHIRHSLRAIH